MRFHRHPSFPTKIQQCVYCRGGNLYTRCPECGHKFVTIRNYEQIYSTRYQFHPRNDVLRYLGNDLHTTACVSQRTSTYRTTHFCRDMNRLGNNRKKRKPQLQPVTFPLFITGLQWVRFRCGLNVIPNYFFIRNQ